MDENSKKMPSQDELDRFWDISALTPRTKRTRGRSPESVEAVEINLDVPSVSEDASAGQRLTVKPQPSAECGERHTSGNKNAASSNMGAGETQSVPDAEYTPHHQLIHRVRIYNKSGVYNYYEQFLNHARKIGRLQGKQSERIAFFSYVPQFSQLTKPQLDWYLWWRECLWNGQYLDTDFSYILLYVYEIINTDGHDNPQWGQRQLCAVWQNYRKTYPRLDRLLGDWICDFSLLHRLPPPSRNLADVLEEALPSCSLKEFYMSVEHTDAVSLSRGKMLLTFCSNYNYSNSKFYTSDNKPAYDEHIPAVIELIADKYTDDKGRLSSDAVGAAGHRIVRDAYSGALCSYAIRKRLEIDYSSFSRSYEFRFMISDSVKYAENKIRAYLGIKSRLSVTSLSPEIRLCIDEYFAKNLSGQKKPQPVREEYEKLYDAPAAPLSIEHAAIIEQTSWETTEKLIEAFEEASSIDQIQPELSLVLPAQPAVAAVPDTASDLPTLASALDEYMEFLRLADGGDTAAMLKYAASRGEMLELIVDKINEISVEAFGDVILEEGEEGYAIIPEYRKEIFND